MQTTIEILVKNGKKQSFVAQKILDLPSIPCGEFEVEDSVWREPAWLVHQMDREEAIAFGRVFRQNTVIHAAMGRPAVIVTDPTADAIGRGFDGNWRVRG